MDVARGLRGLFAWGADESVATCVRYHADKSQLNMTIFEEFNSIYQQSETSELSGTQLLLRGDLMRTNAAIAKGGLNRKLDAGARQLMAQSTALPR